MNDDASRLLPSDKMINSRECLPSVVQLDGKDKVAKNVRLRLRNVASTSWHTSGGNRRANNRIKIIQDRDQPLNVKQSLQMTRVKTATASKAKKRKHGTTFNSRSPPRHSDMTVDSPEQQNQEKTPTHEYGSFEVSGRRSAALKF